MKIWKFDFWHWFGIAAAFGLAIWGSLVLYNFLDQKQGPQVIVKGNYNEFVLPPCNLELSESEKALEKDALEQLLVNDIEKSVTASNIFDYVVDAYPKRLHKEMKRYKTLWAFEVVNKGGKSVTGANLKLPFSGKFLLNKQGEPSVLEPFNQQINLGHLFPDNMIHIYVWTEEPLKDYGSYYFDNASFTYNGGSAQIDFPVEADGMMGWSIRNQNKPLIFAFGISILLLGIIMIIFYNIGLNAAQRKQETVIEFGKGIND